MVTQPRKLEIAPLRARCAALEIAAALADARLREESMARACAIREAVLETQLLAQAACGAAAADLNEATHELVVATHVERQLRSTLQQQSDRISALECALKVAQLAQVKDWGWRRSDERGCELSPQWLQVLDHNPASNPSPRP